MKKWLHSLFIVILVFPVTIVHAESPNKPDPNIYEKKISNLIYILEKDLIEGNKFQNNNRCYHLINGEKQRKMNP